MLSSVWVGKHTLMLTPTSFWKKLRDLWLGPKDMFPPRALEILRQARWQADARPKSHDRWMDLFHHRRFLITGERFPEVVDYERAQESWNYLQQQCWSWPGFKPERCSPSFCPTFLELQEAIYKTL